MGHLERMVNNPLFLGRLHALQFAPTLFAPDNNRKATNQDVVRVISGGIEWLMVPQGTSSIDYQLDMWTSLVNISNTTVVGGVTPPDPTIETSITYFQQWQTNNDWLSLAGHWFHEWMHTAGFLHIIGSDSMFMDAVYTVTGMMLSVETSRLRQMGLMKSRSSGAQYIEGLGKGYFEGYQIPVEYRFVE